MKTIYSTFCNSLTISSRFLRKSAAQKKNILSELGGKPLNNRYKMLPKYKRDTWKAQINKILLMPTNHK